jgi:hypothetical protein
MQQSGNGTVTSQVQLASNSLDMIISSPCAEDLYAKFASANFLIPNLSPPLPVKLLKKLGIHELPGGLKVEDFDYIHTLIYVDEVSFCTSLYFLWIMSLAKLF